MSKYLAVIFGIILMVPLTALAVNLYSGETVNITEPEEGNVYGAGTDVKTKDVVNGDAVLAGANVIVEEVQGNALLAGAEVELNNTIAGDVAVAGANVTINGTIEGDLRAAGAQVRITEDVQGDIFATGSVIEVKEGVTVEGDVIVSGGMVTFDGLAEGDLEARGDTITINGKVQGKSYVQGTQLTFNGSFADVITVSSNSITVGDEAEFQDVSYWTPQEQEFAQSASLTYDTSLESHLNTGEQSFVPELGFGIVYGTLSAGVFMIILMLLFNPFLRHATGQVLTIQDVGRSALLGILLGLGTLALVIILGITIIGIPAAIFLFILWGSLVFFVSDSLVSIMISYWINTRFNLELPYIAIFGVALAVYLLFGGVALLIPWLAVILSLIFGSLSWGAVVYHIYHMRASLKTE